jgi:hypothetical protein
MESRDAALAKSDVKDSLIDLEMQDVVDVVRVYSAIAALENDFTDHTPALFEDKNTGQVAPV